MSIAVSPDVVRPAPAWASAARAAAPPVARVLLLFAAMFLLRKGGAFEALAEDPLLRGTILSGGVAGDLLLALGIETLAEVASWVGARGRPAVWIFVALAAFGAALADVLWVDRARDVAELDALRRAAEEAARPSHSALAARTACAIGGASILAVLGVVAATTMQDPPARPWREKLRTAAALVAAMGLVAVLWRAAG